MSQHLPDFLRRMACEPFVWGGFDCALVIADWWKVNHGFHPAAHLRGTYHSREDCADVVRAAGGLPRLVAGLARSVGAARVCDFVPGNFGVIRFDGIHHGAICTPSGRWAVKGELGMTALAAPRIVVAWSL